MLWIFEALKALADTAVALLFFSCYLSMREWRGITGEQWAMRILLTLAAVLAYAARNTLAEATLPGWGSMAANIATYLLVMFCFSNLLFAGRRSVKLLLSLFSMVLALLFEYAVYLVYLGFTGESYYTTNISAIHYGGVFVAILLEFMAVMLLKKLRRREELQGGAVLYWLQAAVPLLSTLFFVVYPLFAQKEDSQRVFWVIALFGAINMVHYIVFELHQKQARDHREALLREQDYRHREEYYRQVERHQQEIRMIKHDLTNQLISIGAGIRADTGAAAQIDLLVQDIQAKGKLAVTGNAGLDAVFLAKLTRARELGIACELDAKVPDHMHFAQRDLVSLLGNLWDNAVEACQRCPGKREIHFQMLYHKHLLVIRCINSTDGQVTDLHTRKRQAREHGFGTASMAAVVNKYNGDMEYEIGESTFSMELSLWEDPAAQ